MQNKDTVLIFRSKLLPSSETFIVNHYKHLKKYRPILVGWSRDPNGFDLSDTNHLVISEELSLNRPMLFMSKYLHKQKQIYTLFERLKPSLVHVHFGSDAVQIMDVCHRLSIPMIVTLHGFDATFTVRKLLTSANLYLLNYLFKRHKLSRLAAKILPVSIYIKDMALINGFSGANIDVHYLGASISDTALQTAASNRDGILFVGRLVEKKGLTYLISALAQLSQEGKKLKLFVIGEGPLEQQLKEQASSTRINVTFLGKKAHGDVLTCLQASKIFCMPSTRASSGDNEGLPTVFMEALSSGTPIVAFDQGPIPEIVIEGQGGYLAKDKDVSSLAAKIREAFDNEQRWLANAQQGKVMVKERFDIVSRCRHLEHIYDEVSARVAAR